MPSQPVLRGILPVVPTPLTAEGRIDRAGLTRLIDWLNGFDIAGFWVLGTGSEDMNLTFDQRLEVAETASEANAGRAPIMLGAGFFAMDDSLAFIKATEHLKPAAYHALPYHTLLGFDRLEWWYRTLADNCPKQLWMYTSANWGRSIGVDFVARLKDHPNIGGIKFSTSNAVEVAKAAMLADDDFQVMTAVASTLYPSLCLGIKAATSSLASCLPETLIAIYDHFQAGDHPAALAEQQKLINFMDRLAPGGPSKSNFLKSAEEKYLLSLRGICDDYTTNYYRDLTDAERAGIKALVEEFGMF